MKRTELIAELVKFYDTIPDEASSYHIVDMLISRAEGLGMSYIDDKQNGYGLSIGWDLEEE